MSVVRDAAAVWRVLDDDPVASCMVAAVADHGIDPNAIGGELWTLRGADESLCFAGANLTLRGAPGDLTAFADEAMRGARRCSSLVGRADLVMPMWERLEAAWGPARDVRDRQPLLALSSYPSCDIDTAVRQVRPEAGRLPGGRRRHVHRRGRRGSAHRRRRPRLPPAGGQPDHRRACLGAVRARPGGVQGRGRLAVAGGGPDPGVWVHPEWRGLGLGTAGTATVAAVIVGSGRTASLYVNDFNTVARAAYARVGFAEIGTFATVLLD